MTYQFTHWRKSTHSGSQSDCVEVATCDDGTAIGVRDSKAISEPALAFPRTEWAAFVDAVKRDMFHRP